MKRNKIFIFIILMFLVSSLLGCGKVTSDTSSKTTKAATPVAVIKGTIDVSKEATLESFSLDDEEIYVVITKVKPDGTEQELAWGKAKRVIKIQEIVPTKSWQTKKSIINKAINNVITANAIEVTSNIQPTININDKKEDKEKDKEKKEESKEKNKKEEKEKDKTKDINTQPSTQNIVKAMSFDKKDKEVNSSQEGIVFFSWTPSPNPHWEYSISGIKKGPAYFVIRAYNKNNSKLFATYFEGNSITTSNSTVTVQSMDALSTLRAYILLCTERNDVRIDYGRVNIKNLKKRVTKTLMKKMNYSLPDIRQDNFKNKEPKFKQIPKESIENEIAEAVSKEESSFDQYKIYIQNISSSILNDDARKILLMENPPQDEPTTTQIKKNNSKNNPKSNKVNTTPNIEEITTDNKETKEL